MNRNMSAPGNQQDEIEAKAAAWVIRLDGDSLSRDEERALEVWLDAHPANRRAFDHACATWRDLSQLRAAPDPLADAAARASASHVFRGHHPWRWARGGAIAAAVLMGVTWGMLGFADPLTVFKADYRTASAEKRTVTLPDGSTIDLAPESAITLKFNGQERRIVLLSGAIYVAAAPMRGHEDRPFIVQTEEGTARALGTQFSIEHLPATVRVDVVEHQVEVVLRDAGYGGRDGAGEERVVLSPGQSVRYRAGSLASPQRTSIAQVAAWRRDRLVFNDVPLAEVVAEFNRYRRGVIVLDAGLSNRRVSGVFETARLDDALLTIIKELRLGVTSLPFVTWIH